MRDCFVSVSFQVDTTVHVSISAHVHAIAHVLISHVHTILHVFASVHVFTFGSFGEVTETVKDAHVLLSHVLFSSD